MTRFLSGAALILLLVGAVVWLPPLGLLAVAEVVALLAAHEFVALAAALGARVPAGGAMVATAATCAAVPLAPWAIGIVLATVMLAAACVALASGRIASDAFHGASATVFAALYLGVPLGALVAIRAVHGLDRVALVMLTIIVSDTAQYYAGRALGRRLLAPAVSPKKTLEGAIGGFVFGAATFAIVGAWWLPTVTSAWRVLIGLAVVGLGLAGDLFESMLKRAAGVKDSSALIPGHGGMLDRIDALLFASPFYYVILLFVG